MVELKILSQRDVDFNGKKITYRGFENVNGNLTTYGFEAEYMNNGFLCRKVFKNAANDTFELNNIIDLLYKNTAQAENMEEIIEEILMLAL